MQFGPFLFPEGPGAGRLPQITEAIQAVLAPTAGSLGRPRRGRPGRGMGQLQEGLPPGRGCLYLSVQPSIPGLLQNGKRLSSSKVPGNGSRVLEIAVSRLESEGIN